MKPPESIHTTLRDREYPVAGGLDRANRVGSNNLANEVTIVMLVYVTSASYPSDGDLVKTILRAP